jgi:hypothetical protein
MDHPIKSEHRSVAIVIANQFPVAIAIFEKRLGQETVLLIGVIKKWICNGLETFVREFHYLHLTKLKLGTVFVLWMLLLM